MEDVVSFLIKFANYSPHVIVHDWKSDPWNQYDGYWPKANKTTGHDITVKPNDYTERMSKLKSDYQAAQDQITKWSNQDGEFQNKLKTAEAQFAEYEKTQQVLSAELQAENPRLGDGGEQVAAGHERPEDEAKYEIQLKDGQSYRAVRVVESEGQLVFRDVKGTFHTVKIADVLSKRKLAPQ